MGWHRVTSIAEAARARPWVAAAVAGVELVIGRAGEGWYAVDGRCTHAGCAFADDASLEDGRIVCNCHGSEFDLRTGEVRRGPAEYDVRSFPVRVVGEDLEVEV